ncbi:hypothetical protein [Photobacterium lipolyticum]|uniref:Uncharacterized protein n=1 Tax=Photobacterium lipolyticum TaxID=266810 RepID=A0A2T3MZM4_9GAMM|nr:hypothetical protein [Photobacterium lipolyticum]PSW05427.1 hypothetical protein C9I89_09245 [Photobacterium lipolyticum]
MVSSDLDGIKSDISLTVNDIFENLEEDNNRLPTKEEFRTIFSNHTEQYIGPLDELTVEGIRHGLNKQRVRELDLWRAVNELEADQRFLRSS